jgi:3-hydroxybutyryl-CoA dehydratase
MPLRASVVNHVLCAGGGGGSTSGDARPQIEAAVTLPVTQTLYFEDLGVGMTETYAKLVKSSDVVGFAEITGDRNPIHLSEHFAAKTPFRSRIAHGLYTAGLISAVIGTRLPGPGAIYLSQTLNFKAPVRIGDTVVASVEVVELIAHGRRAKLRCQCKVGDTIVLDGEALVKIPPRPEPRA